MISGTERTGVLIIGGGASAVAIAAALGAAGLPLPFVVAERNPRFALGVAYSTELEHHILNVPAKLMGIDARAPEGFLQWCMSNAQSISGDEFVSRQLYGKYLQEVLRGEISRGNGTLWNSEVIALEKCGESFRATGSDGASLIADSVVMAVGHSALEVSARNIIGSDSRRLVNNPWSAAGYQDLEQLEAVAIIGTGLTAMDVVGALDKRGYMGTLLLCSRRGLLPFASRGEGRIVDVPISQEVLQLPLRDLTHWIRSRISQLSERGEDWRSVIDAFRAHIPTLWRRFSDRERSWFQRHLRPYWEVVRHRMPDAVSARVGELNKCGRLTIVRGRVGVIDLLKDKSSVKLSINSVRGQSSFSVGRVFNCTGGAALRPSNLSPLLSSMHQREMISLDRFGLGILTTSDGCVLDSRHSPLEGLYAVGPLRRASDWESTAMREVREQAAMIVQKLKERSVAPIS